MEAAKRINEQFTACIIETGAHIPHQLTISRKDYAELSLLSYFDFIPDDAGLLTIPTYHGARIVLINEQESK